MNTRTYVASGPTIMLVISLLLTVIYFSCERSGYWPWTRHIHELYCQSLLSLDFKLNCVDDEIVLQSKVAMHHLPFHLQRSTLPSFAYQRCVSKFDDEHWPSYLGFGWGWEQRFLSSSSLWWLNWAASSLWMICKAVESKLKPRKHWYANRFRRTTEDYWWTQPESARLSVTTCKFVNLLVCLRREYAVSSWCDRVSPGAPLWRKSGVSIRF